MEQNKSGVELEDRRFRKITYRSKKKVEICTVCKCRAIPKGPIRGCVLTRMCEVCWSEGLTTFEDEFSICISTQ
jgi:hypothetical protein